MAMEEKVEGKRPLGRPRNTWFKDIKMWTDQTANECTKNAGECLCGVSLHVNGRRVDNTPR